MTRFKKISLWITGSFILFALLLLTLVLSIDKVINQKQILNKIQTGVSEAINGQVDFQHIHVSFFPRPQLVVQQCRFSIPGTIKGTAVSLSIAPKLLPLIAGKFQNSRISLNSPDIEIYLKRSPGPGDNHSNSLSSENAEEKVGAIFGVVLSKIPGLRIRLKNAQFKIIEEQKTSFWLQHIDSGINILKDHITFDLHGDTSISKNISLKGAVYLYKDNLSFSLENLKLSDPRLKLSGKLDIRRALPSPRVNLELLGKDVDVESTRKAVLNLAKENFVVNDIFKIIKGGEVPLIQFVSHGNSMEELGELENIFINGSIKNGKIFVPNVDLDLTDVEGDVTVSKGILKGKNLKARMGTSKCLDGSLKLGLKGEDAPFHLDLSLDANLAQLPPVLKRVVHNEAFIKENSLLGNIKGRAKGRLVLGESVPSINVLVNVSQFNLSANYRRLPRLLVINGGRFYLKGKTSSIKNVSGSMGNSTFTRVSGQMNWDDMPLLKIVSGEAKIDLEEIYPWLSSFEIFPKKLRELKNVKGIVTLSSMDLNGPFLEPKNYQFQLSGDVRNLTLDSPLLPGRLAAAEGTFNMTSENISITDFRTRIHDTSLKVSGTIKDYPKGLNRFDMTFQGEIGPDVTRWVEDAANLSPVLRFKPPISVSTAHLVREEQQQTLFSGTLFTKKGIKITTDFLVNPEKLAIEKLIIQDQVSNATLKLGQNKRFMDVLFAGNLQKETLDNILEKNELLKGQLKGDLNAHVPLDQPLTSTVKGDLTVKEFIFPKKTGTSFIIHDLSLETRKDILQVESARLALGDNSFDLKGNLALSATTPKLDMEFFSDVLNLDQLKRDLYKNSENNSDQTAEKSRIYPVRGLVKAKINRLTFNDLTWEPFEADIHFNDNGAAVTITNARLCGITTLGNLEIRPGGISIDLKPSAQNQELNPSIQCLSDKSAKIAGDFNLKGNIKANGTAKTLMQNSKGDLEFYASKGSFHAGRGFRILIKIFSILNVTELFKGKLPNLETEGFSFNSIHAKAGIQNGKLVLNEMIIDGTSMNIVCQGDIDLVKKQMDVTALVAPLKAIDFFIKRTPIVKDILGGSLISIPVGIKGLLVNPNVTPLPASKVGEGLLGIVKRTLQLPVKIIQPIIPDKETN